MMTDLSTKRAHGDELEDTILDVCQARMVAIEDALGAW